MATKDITCYFKHNGPSALLNSVSRLTIDSVNRELVAVSSVSQSDGPKNGKSRGEYNKISAKERAIICEYAAKNGIAAAIHHYKFERSQRSWLKECLL